MTVEQDYSEEQRRSDIKVLHEMGYAQELARRMGAFQNFAISFAIICIVAGGITAFPAALSAGGGAAVGIIWPLGSLFALLVAAAMGQVASAYPTAGGIYHWSSLLGGRGYGWVGAWFNMLGLIFVVSSVNFGVYNLFRDLFLAQVLGWDVTSWTSTGDFSEGWWRQTMFIVGVTVVQAIINHFFLRLTTVLTDFSGYLILATAVLLTGALLLFMGHSPDVNRLFTFTNLTGEAGGNVWPSSTMPWFFILGLGLLHVVYTITGYDASAHTSEETRNAPVEVPRGMIRSVLWSCLFGYAMVAAFVLALPDQTGADGKVVDGVSAGAAQGWASFNWMLQNSPMPQALKSALIVGIVLSNFLCALAGLTSMSRMMYAFARDGGLPASHLLRTVSPTYRTPGPAIWVGGLLAILATLYGDAFLVLSTGCAVFLYISYLMPIAAAMVSEMGGNWKHKGPFNLGGLSIPIALLAIVGCAVLITVGVVPPQQKVGYLIIVGLLAMASFWGSMEGNRIVGLLFAALSAAAVWVLWGMLEGSENAHMYAAVVFGIMLVLSLIVHGKKFHGPPMGDEIRQRAAEIAAEEARVGEKKI